MDSINEVFDSMPSFLEVIINTFQIFWENETGRWLILLLLGLFLLEVVILLGKYFFAIRRRNKIRGLFENQTPISPEEFMKIRKVKGKLNPALNVTGVYVLHNESKDLYYVGQGKSVSKRVFSHFNGSGNGDVYADYKYNDKFTIRLLPLYGSGYDTLDDLERHAIKAYSAYTKGYNRNRGNGVKTT